MIASIAKSSEVQNLWEWVAVRCPMRKWLARAGLFLASLCWLALMPGRLSGDENAIGRADFQHDVLPVLQTFCADCHTQKTSGDRWAFDRYEKYADLMADQKAWRKVGQLVEYRIMPPHGEAAPSEKQRQAILDWIESAVFYVDPARPDPGETVLRRLNRAEYNNTVRDVFGVTSQPADQFPADDAGYGFDNIADVLSISPLHFEKYLAAAREVAGEITRLGPPPRIGVERRPDALTIFAGKPDRQNDAVRLRSPAEEVGVTVRVPRQTFYRILIRASSPKGQEKPTPIDVLCDGKPITTLEAKGTSYVLAELPAGEHRIALRADATGEKREPNETLATIRFLSISGPFTPTPPQTSDFLREAAGTKPLAPPVLRLSGEELDQGSGRSSLDTGKAWFSTNGYRHAPVRFTAEGRYRVRFKVGAQQVGDDPVRFEVRVGKKTLGPFAVTAKSQAEEWVETICELPQGEHDWQVWFINEYTDPKTDAQRWFWLHEFTVEGPLENDYGLSPDETIKLLKQTGRRLYRRPLTKEESQKLAELVKTVLEAEETTHTALRIGLEALLVSPKFLYHPQPRPVGDPQHGTALVDELTLASRLAYFLWSSAPDEELLALAEEGQLRKQFAARVKRMIRDPKSRALTENFAGQWLQLRNLEHITPDPKFFPDFDANLASDMRRETELVFEHILQGNRPVLDFLNADYTFLNARLAKHYGLPTPAAKGFHRVSLEGSSRRGVLTHASILTLTSLPTRTSPVKRGKWLLEQMLGEEPPPPPADIPPLPAAAENVNLPLRVQLVQHRTDLTCASCHALLDPPGFALENFDAIGRWRTKDGDQPIDASGRLITGERFSDWADLRRVLVKDKSQQFAECFVEQLLTYALGRGLTYRDKPAVRDILQQSRAANHRFQDVILALCDSVPFQRMRIPSP